MKNYCLIVVAVLLLTSCKRKGSMSGKVVNAYNGQPVKGIQLRLEGMNSGLFASKNNQRLDDVVSDENGQFTFNYKFQDNKRSYYTITAMDKLGGIDTAAPIFEKYMLNNGVYCLSCVPTVSGTEEELKSTVIKVAPACRLKLRHQRISGNYNYLYVTFGNEIFAASAQYSSYYSYAQQQFIDWDVYTLVPATGKIYLTWTASQYNNPSSNSVTYYDTLDVTPFGKIDYLIKW